MIKVPFLEALVDDPLVTRLVEAHPHHFPPNCGSPVVKKIDGRMKRITGPIQSMNNETWAKYKCDTVDYTMILIEVTPNGKRVTKSDGKPLTMSIKHGHGDNWKHCFGKCMLCWRLDLLNFGRPDICPFPYTVDVDHPTLPRLGVCGCVICNQCITNTMGSNQSKTDCPYCAWEDSFYRGVRMWPVSSGHKIPTGFSKAIVDGFPHAD